MTEQDFRKRILHDLEPYFQIHTEIPGTHFSGKRFRLDAVVTPHNHAEWKNPRVALGIEFKDVLRLRGDTNNFTKWLTQCVDYSNTTWEGFGYLFIFACPSLADDIPAGGCEEEVARILNAVMGQMGLGELRYEHWYGLTFILHSRHRIWSAKRGVEEGHRYTLERKFGSG